MLTERFEASSPAVVLTVLGPLWVLAVGCQSRGAAVVLLTLYAAIFAFLSLRHTASAVLFALLLLPLVTVELGLSSTQRTVSADKLALGAAGACWWIKSGWGRTLAWARRCAAVRWLGGLCLVVAIGAGVRGFRIEQLLQAAEYFAWLTIFLMALEAFAEPEAREFGLRYFVIGATVVSALTVLQFMIFAVSGHTMPLFFKSGTSRDMVDPVTAISTIGDKNYLSGFMAMAIPITATGLLGHRRSGRWMSGPLTLTIILVLQSAAIIITQSVATLWAVGLLLVASITFGARRLRSSGKILVAATAVGAAALGWYFVSWSNSIAFRLEFHRVAFRMIMDHPVGGLGAHGFFANYLSYEPQGLFDPREFPRLANPHSTFLDIAVSWGLPGLACFVGALLAVLFRPCMISAGNIARQVIVPSVGLSIGLLAFVVNAASESLFAFSKVAAIFWIGAALLLRLTPSETKPVNESGRPPLTASRFSTDGS